MEKLGFNLTQVGAFLGAGVAGSAFFAFIVSLTSEKIGRKRLLIIFALLPVLTGVALVFIDDFLSLVFFTFAGSIVVCEGGPILPLEQASLSDTAPLEKRTDLFTVYRIASRCGFAFGTLATDLPVIFQDIFP